MWERQACGSATWVNLPSQNSACHQHHVWNNNDNGRGRRRWRGETSHSRHMYRQIGAFLTFLRYGSTPLPPSSTSLSRSKTLITQTQFSRGCAASVFLVQPDVRCVDRRWMVTRWEMASLSNERASLAPDTATERERSIRVVGYVGKRAPVA
jgi:hypothetical protein